MKHIQEKRARARADRREKQIKKRWGTGSPGCCYVFSFNVSRIELACAWLWFRISVRTKCERKIGRRIIDLTWQLKHASRVWRRQEKIQAAPSDRRRRTVYSTVGRGRSIHFLVSRCFLLFFSLLIQATARRRFKLVHIITGIREEPGLRA